MPSEKFLSELASLSPEEWVDTGAHYLINGIVPENRAAVFETFSKRIYEAIFTQEHEETPRLLSLQKFMETTDDNPPPLVADFLPSKKLICLSGTAKEGKSLVVLQVLQDICTGATMMGTFPVEQNGPVAYFALEDGGSEIKERITTRGKLDMPGYHICVSDSMDFHSVTGWGKFLSMIEGMEYPPVLVVIDTGREAYAGIQDWNDSAKVGPALKNLRKWSHANCTVILVCHNNKDKLATGVNRVSGSGALVSSCDVVAVLSNKLRLDNDDLQWDYEIGGRGIRQVKHKLHMNTNTLAVRVLTDDEAAQARAIDYSVAKRETFDKILQVMSKHIAYTARIIAEATGLGLDYVRRTMREMELAGLFIRGEKIRENGSKSPSISYIRADTPPVQEPKKIYFDDGDEGEFE